MNCIHGFDEINCPVCRISFSQIPLDPITKIEIKKKDLISKNLLFERNRGNKKNQQLDLIPNHHISPPKLIQNLPKPQLLGEIPTFSNELYKKRIKSDNFNFLNKVPIDNPELDLEEKE